MVLNSDCMRDVLIAIERMQQYFTNDRGNVEKDILSLEQLHSELPAYGKEEIYYTLFTLDQAGFVNISERWGDDCVNVCFVNYLTFSGHEFLSKIRDESRWHGIKKALPAIRNYSLDAISAISQGMTSAAISAYLERNP